MTGGKALTATLAVPVTLPPSLKPLRVVQVPPVGVKRDSSPSTDSRTRFGLRWRGDVLGCRIGEKSFITGPPAGKKTKLRAGGCLREPAPPGDRNPSRCAFLNRPLNV